MKISIFMLYFFAILGWESIASAQNWPRVREFELSFGIDTSSKRIFLLIPILDYNNEEQYRLVCRGGNDNYLDKLSSETGINYVGPLGCSLFDKPIIESERSLLSEADTPPWHTRGQISYESLIGDCGEYPEYGRIRHFRLRGFELTMSVDDLFLVDDKLEYFVLTVSLREDETIISSRTEQPGYISPKRTAKGCQVVVTGNVPIRCRNPETFLWQQCSDE